MNPSACCIELSQNIDRAATMNWRLSCLLPSGKQWIRLNRKDPDWATSSGPKPTEEIILFGGETCMIQGIPTCIVDKAVDMGFSNNKLQDLSANAFDGRVYGLTWPPFFLRLIPIMFSSSTTRKAWTALFTRTCRMPTWRLWPRLLARECGR